MAANKSQEKEDAVKEKDRTERRSRKLRFVLVNAGKQDEQMAERDEDREASEDESQPGKEEAPATEEWQKKYNSKADARVLDGGGVGHLIGLAMST
jgi:hypothetical protein